MKKGAPPPAQAARSRKDWGIGELAIYNKLLKEEQLAECRRIQEAMTGSGFPMGIGQVLIEKYYLDAATVRALVRARAEMAGPDFDPSAERVDIVKLTPNEHEVLVDRIREKKLVPPERIDECFDIQCRLLEFGIDKDLGEILLQRGYVERRAIEDLLRPHTRTKMRLQREVVSEDSDVLVAASDPGTTTRDAFRRGDKFQLPENRRLLFGKIAAEKGLLTDDQVEEALFVQFKLKELGVIKRLGEVMVEKRFIQKNDVKRILAVQKQLHGKIKWVDKNLTVSQKREDVLLQQLLLKNEILGAEEVNECLYVQHVMRKLGIEKALAGVIVDKEYLEHEVVRAILKEFKRAQEEEARKAKEEKADFQARTAESGFVFADVKLKNAYLDILKSHKPDDLSASVERRADPIRSRPTARVVPAWPFAAALVLLLGLVGAYAFWRGLQPRSLDSADAGAPVEDGSRPASAGRVDTGRTTGPPVAPEPDQGGETPAVEAPYLVELRQAAAALAFSREAAVPHEEKRTLAAVAVSPVQVRSLPSACFFVFRAHFWLPPGATIKTEIFYRGSQSVSAAQILPVGADGSLQSWFGPFSWQPPDQLFGEFASPWALCGPYTIRFTFHLPSQEEPVRRGCDGLPFLDDSGAAIVDWVFHHPDRDSFEREAAQQEKFLTSRLRELLAYLQKGRSAIGARADSYRAAVEKGRREGPERNALLEAAGEFRQAVDQVRSALGNLHDNLLAVPQPHLFRVFEDLLGEGERLAGASTEEGAARFVPAAGEFDRSAKTLATHLGS